MDNAEVLSRINQLAREQHTLWDKAASGEATDADRLRLKLIQAALDQHWDYLNQRRALVAARRSPDAAQMRDLATIEGYVR